MTPTNRLALLGLALVAGCGHHPKASVDAGADAAAPDAPTDLAPDASRDLGPDAATPIDAAPDLAPDATPDVATEAGIAGVATLIGQTNHAGTTVQVEGQAARATTAADGSFVLPVPPAGDYHLLLDNGEYHEVVPNFRVLASGQAVLFASREYPLPPIELSRARRLVSGDRDRDYQYQLWPDGSILNVARRPAPDKPFGIELLPASGKAALFTLEGAGSRVTVLEKQRFLAEKLAAGNTLDVVLGSLGGAAPVTLATGLSYDRNYGLLPGRDVLYYLLFQPPAAGYTVMTTPLDAPAPHKVVDLATGSRFSPDGHYYAFVVAAPAPTYRTRTLRLVNVDTGTAIDVSNQQDSVEPQFTSDSKYLVFSGDALRSQPVAGGPSIRLGPAAKEFRLTPDGKLVIYLGTGESPYFSVPVAGGTPLDISGESPGSTGFNATISPDGSHIFYQGHFNQGHATFKAAATGAMKVTNLADSDGAVLTHSADGRRVFFVAGNTLATWALGSAEPPTEIAHAVSLVAGSPGRSQLLFRENVSGSPGVGMLVALDLATLERKELGMTSNAPVKLSHDERLVLKTDPSYQVQLVRISDGKVLGAYETGEPLAFSPDDKQLALVATGYVDVIAPTDGGAAVAVGRNSGDLVWMSGRVVFTRTQVREPFAFANGLYWGPGL
jgi:hypothetical protein